MNSANSNDSTYTSSLLFLGDLALGKNKENKKKLGSKAYHLHELLLQNVQVPPAFVLPTFLSHDEFEIRKNLDQLNLLQAIEKLGGFPVAVRSSSCLEDLTDKSYAGMYESYLEINSVEMLYEAVLNCLESASSTRVREYCREANIQTLQQQFRVIIQKQINADYAGVLFTLNPVSGKEEELLVEYCAGLGDQLVSGKINPSRIIVHKFSQQICEHHIESIDHKLPLTSLQELIKCASKIEQCFLSPQDIEWCLDEMGRVYILQARPLTTFFPRTDVPELTDADFKDGGISARVCTPMMYSLYEAAMQKSMPDYFKAIGLHNPSKEKINWIYLYYGRAYWNVGIVKNLISQLPGFNEIEFDQSLGIQKKYELHPPRITSLNFKSILKAIPVLYWLHREFDRCEVYAVNSSKSFDKMINRFKHLPFDSMDNQSLYQVTKEIFSFQERTEYEYFRTIYNNSNYQSEFSKYLDKLNVTSEEKLILMTSLSNVSHLKITEGLNHLRDLYEKYGETSSPYLQEVQVFLADHYHHGHCELDLSIERWGENHHLITEMVKQHQIKKLDHTQLGANSKISTLKNNLKTRNKGSLLSLLRFEKKLERSRNFIILREHMRERSTKAYFFVRKVLVEWHKRINLMMQSSDSIEKNILMLTKYEFLEFLQNNVQSGMKNRFYGMTELLKSRYSHYCAMTNIIAPHEFGGTIQSNSHLEMDKSSRDISSFSDSSNHILKGVACSPGIIKGTAKILKDLNDSESFHPGQILITIYTDPGWTPLLARAAGVVTEVGGILSHAAVISREYSIPAVLNVSNALKKIKDGQEIIINGNNGTVTLL